MGKKMSKETKKSAEAKKKPVVKELDITSLPELIFDNDKGCIVAEFGDGRDSVMIELNGTQFAAAVLKINNEIYCCSNEAEEKFLREELEKKVRSCRGELNKYIQDTLKGFLKQQLNDVINSLKKRAEEESYHLGCRLGNLCSFLRNNKVADPATELGKRLKELQDFLKENKNKIESHYSIEELGDKLKYYHKLLENNILKLKWLNEFKKSEYFKENQDHTRVVSKVLSEARQKIKNKLMENGINISIEALLPMTTNRMIYPQEKIRFQGLDPFYEVAKGVFAIKGLQGIILSEDRTEIEFIPNDFKGELNIPEGVRRIRWEVFNRCGKITSIRIPKSVTFIGGNIEGSLYECIFFEGSELKQLEVAEENPKYKSINGMLLNKKGTELMGVPQGIKEGVQIPESVTEIGCFAFEGCTGLTSITIPKSVTEIGWLAFEDCTGLERIEVAKENPKYKSINGMLFNKEGTRLLCVPGGIKGNVQIPQGVTEIEEFLFQNCIFKSITIPKSMKYISWDAFVGCTSLKSLKEIYFDGVEEDASERLKQFFENAWNNFKVTVYCRNGTKGWGKIFGGLPTKEIEAKD